jgi:transposase-like protein
VPRTRPPYPAAFRAEAVELARTGGKTIPELAKDLGVSGQTLRTGSTRPTWMPAAAGQGS